MWEVATALQGVLKSKLALCLWVIGRNRTTRRYLPALAEDVMQQGILIAPFDIHPSQVGECCCKYAHQEVDPGESACNEIRRVTVHVGPNNRSIQRLVTYLNNWDISFQMPSESYLVGLPSILGPELLSKPARKSGMNNKLNNMSEI